jgi:hypothetical protein
VKERHCTTASFTLQESLSTTLTFLFPMKCHGRHVCGSSTLTSASFYCRGSWPKFYLLTYRTFITLGVWLRPYLTILGFAPSLLTHPPSTMTTTTASSQPLLTHFVFAALIYILLLYGFGLLPLPHPGMGTAHSHAPALDLTGSQGQLGIHVGRTQECTSMPSSSTMDLLDKSYMSIGTFEGTLKTRKHVAFMYKTSYHSAIQPAHFPFSIKNPLQRFIPVP